MQGKDPSDQGARARSHAGVDVCEGWLDHILPAGVSFRVANTASGHRQPKRRLKSHGVELIVIEGEAEQRSIRWIDLPPNGKWHRPLHRSLHASGHAAAVAGPLRARLFAEAIGVLAKLVLGPAKPDPGDGSARRAHAGPLRRQPDARRQAAGAGGRGGAEGTRPSA